MSVKNEDKPAMLSVARELVEIGFKIVATGGTHAYLTEHNIEAQRVNKVMEGQPHIVDSIINGEINLVINTTTKSAQAVSDSYSIRRMALMNKIPYYTLITAATAAVQAIHALKDRDLNMHSLQSYFPKEGKSKAA